MRTSLRIGLTIACSLAMTACAAGPHQLRRSVDDWDHKIYVNSPWLNAAMWIVPIYPTLHAGALALDFAVTDPYHFWFGDAWDGNGTGYRHLPVEWTDGWVDCMLADDGDWTRSRR